ncbi:hypothetical protein LTS10_002529 [Elasticomyces elasticus]|nr:hypothetical protein LTS10_002529 [Elasticomyces elasticus]
MVIAPPAVVGRYRLYKAGTEKVALWLARTASRFCDVHIITETVQRSRREADRRRQQQRVKFSTRHLVAFATAITSATPLVAIPTYILRLLEDVIAGRQYCADWYAAQPSEEDGDMSKQNEGHAHFIAVLENVLSLLSVCTVQQRPRQPSAPTATSPDPSRSLHSLFATLEIEKTSMDASEAETTPSTLDPESCDCADPDATDFVFSDEGSSSLAFEAWCLLQDLHDMRACVRDTWHEYSRGEVSIFAAGMVADSAFRLMRRHEAEFVNNHPEIGDYEKLFQFLNIGLVVYEKLVLVMPNDSGASAQRPVPAINPAALLCPSAGFLLHQFAELVGRRLLEKACESPELAATLKEYGYEPSKWDMPTHCQGHRFGETLSRHLPRILAHGASTRDTRLAGDTCDSPADEFLEGLYHLVAHLGNGGGTPIWLVVACQTYMDIYDILGHRIDAAATAFVRCHVETAVAVQRYDTARQDCVFGTLLPTWKDHFKDVTDNGYTFVSGLEAYRKQDPQTRTLPKVVRFPSVPAEAVLDLPVLAAELLCRLKMPNAYYGTTVCNDGFFVLALAHFYTAARQYGLVSVWEDMELVITQNSGLVLPVSDNADAWAMARHYRLALGVPASQLSRKGVVGTPGSRLSVSRTKTVEVTATLFRSLAKHQRNAAMSVLSTDQLFETVLNTLADASAAEAEKSTASKSKRNKSSRRTFSPLELVETLKEHLIASEVQLNFDYISFFRTCIEIILAMMKHSCPELSHDTGTLPAPAYELVDVLLREAAGAVAAGVQVSATVFATSAAILETAIMREGGSLKRAAFEKSSGHIPEHMRPKLAGSEEYKSDARASLESKGFRFDGPGRTAAIYPPSFETAALVEDIKLVKARLLEWAETRCEVQEVPEEDIAGKAGKDIGMHRWGNAMDLIRLQEEHIRWK